MKKGNPNKCWYCGEDEKCTKDHFYPKKFGGTLIVYACKICQSAKGDLMPDEFVEYIKSNSLIKPRKKIRIITAIYTLMFQTKNQYLKIKSKQHKENFGELLINHNNFNEKA